MSDTATQPTKMTCPSCESTLKLNPKHLGKKLKCGKCGSVLEFDRETGQLFLEPVDAELIKRKGQFLDVNANARSLGTLFKAGIVLVIVFAALGWLCIILLAILRTTIRTG